MSTARCCICDRPISLDDRDGDFDPGEYVCQGCMDEEMSAAQNYINHMRQVAHENML